MLKLAAVLLLAALLLPSIGMAQTTEREIQIDENGESSSWSYSPARVTIPAGTTVTWKNSGQMRHSITSQDQLFDSRLLDPGKSWSHTFDTPGVYRYFCVPYPWIKGVIIVTEANQSTSTPTSTPNPSPPTPTQTPAP